MATRLPSRFGPAPVLTSPRTAVFSGLSYNESEGPGPRSWTGPVSGPKRSLRLDLEALAVVNVVVQVVLIGCRG
jgi:hypothetical protein